MDIKDLTQEDFDRIGNNINNWIDNSENLLASGEFLIVQARGDNAYMGFLYSGLFLKGLGVESGLKAVYLKKGNTLVSEGKLEKNSHTHGLLGLAKRIELNTTQTENEILEKLTEIIDYIGRYPIPTKFDKLKDKSNFDIVWKTKHFDILDSIIQKIRDAYKD